MSDTHASVDVLGYVGGSRRSLTKRHHLAASHAPGSLCGEDGPLVFNKFDAHRLFEAKVTKGVRLPTCSSCTGAILDAINRIVDEAKRTQFLMLVDAAMFAWNPTPLRQTETSRPNQPACGHPPAVDATDG